MNTFAPIFSDISESSIWEEPYHVRLAWVMMLAKKDANHIVWCDAWLLHKWANISVEEAEDALKVLSNPDRRKPGQEHGGRRIQKVDDGWLVINGDRYERLMSKIARRFKKARWARENREKLKQTPLDGEMAYDHACKHGTAEEIQRTEANGE